MGTYNDIISRAYLKKLRTDFHYKQPQLAEYLGVTLSQYKHLETEGMRMSMPICVTYLYNLSKLYKISIYDLICLETDFQLAQLRAKGAINSNEVENLEIIDDNNFPCKLRQERTALKLTQGQLAKKLKTARQYVSHWESGTSLPSEKTIDLLCSLFGRNREFFFLEKSSDVTKREG